MSKRAGRKSQQANDFLQPYAPSSVSSSDVGTNRPYTASASGSEPASGVGGAASVSWTMDPLSPAATSYSITTTPTTYTKTVSSGTSTTFEGLASNTAYTFTVVATNASGSSTGTTSSSTTITTVPATPSAPTASSTVEDQDSVSWVAPTNGGKAISGYSWSCDDGKSGTTSSTSITVAQEGAGSSTNAYKVYATNANGNSAYSAYSNSVDTVAPYFPYFPFFPPFFPPYFPYFPFFPPFFPPYFPFFPPYFPFFPPFFPPYFPFFPPYFPYFPYFPFFPPYFPSFGPFFPPYFPFFPPFFPYFPAFAPFFPPFFPPYFPGCIDEQTDIAIKNIDGTISYKMAKEIQEGDILVAATWTNLTAEVDEDPHMWSDTNLNDISYNVAIVNKIIPSTKAVTMYINGDTSKRFSLEQTILFRRNNVWMFSTTGAMEIGDYIMEADGNSFTEIKVDSIDLLDEERTVFQFELDTHHVFIAGGILVHNRKVYF